MNSMQQRGLTLVELMIGLTLGIILMWGAIQIFIAGQHSYNESQRFSTLQGHLGFISDSLLNDSRGAFGINLNASFDAVTITQDETDIVYQLNANEELTRTVTGEAAAVIADRVQGLVFSCLDADSAVVDCADAVMLLTTVSFETGADDYVLQHQFSFRVALRNAVMTQKFSATP
jgi:type IV pilus assembly protein PilW